MIRRKRMADFILVVFLKENQEGGDSCSFHAPRSEGKLWGETWGNPRPSLRRRWHIGVGGGGAPPGERGDKWLCYGRLSCRTLVVSMLRRVMGECLCAWVGMTKWASEEGNGFAKQCPDASLLSVTRAWRHLSVINAKEKEFPFFWCQWW